MLNDLILVAGVKPEVRKGVVVGISQDDKPQEGRVLKAGPGRMLEDGTRVDMTIKPGMYILFNEHTTTKFNIEGVTYYTLHEEDVVGYQ